MIVKNEEDVIARCLESAREIADEIVIVDTGSTDRTKERCARYTDKIFDFEWIDDFAAARNQSFAHATCDYCLWLDADDVISDADKKKFLDLKASLENEDVVFCRYHVAFDEQGNPTFSYYRERLIRRLSGLCWEGFVHECITPKGNLRYSDAAVCHRKLHASPAGRNLEIYRKMQQKGVPFSPRHLFYFARELFYNGFFEECETNLLEFLEGEQGWRINCIDACGMLADCYERTNQSEKILPALFRSFLYAPPQAEICCRIGAHFLGKAEYACAIFWYECALRAKPQPEQGGFVQADCYGFLPLIQLCVCYDRIGEIRKAAEYNRLAAALRPDHPAVRSNLEYFARKHQ